MKRLVQISFDTLLLSIIPIIIWNALGLILSKDLVVTFSITYPIQFLFSIFYYIFAVGPNITAEKKKDKNILFGISPEGNIDNNYTSNYIDTKKFAGNSGYVDYLMPQIYFGFFNSIKPFYETVKEWNNYIKTDTVKLIPALAFYKVGEEDLYAKDGQYEWIEYNNIIAREVLASRPLSNYQGFAIFRYDSIFNDNLTSYAFKEKENLKKILK